MLLSVRPHPLFFFSVETQNPSLAVRASQPSAHLAAVFHIRPRSRACCCTARPWGSYRTPSHDTMMKQHPLYVGVDGMTCVPSSARGPISQSVISTERRALYIWRRWQEFIPSLVPRSLSCLIEAAANAALEMMYLYRTPRCGPFPLRENVFLLKALPVGLLE